MRQLVWLVSLLWVLWSGFVIHRSAAGPFRLEDLLESSERAGHVAYRQEISRPDDLIVVITGGDARQREGVVDQLKARLELDPEHFASVFARLDVKFVRPTMLYFLSQKQLQDTLHQLVPLHRRISKESNLSDWMTDTSLGSPSQSGLTAQLRDHYLKELELSLETRGRHEFQPPWLQALKLPEAFWELYEGKTLHYLTIEPSGHVLMVTPRGSTTAALKELRAVTQDVLARNPLMAAHVSGGAAILADQAWSLWLDVLKLNVLCAVVMFVTGRSGRPMGNFVKAMLTVGVSLLWTLAISLLILGPAGLTALLAFPLAAAVSACLAILAAYQNSARRTLRSGLLMGLAFVPLVLTGFPAAAQLGMVLIVAALSATLALTTLYPSLLRGRVAHPEHLEVQPLRSVTRALLVLAVAGVLTGFAWHRPANYHADFVALLDPRTESMLPERMMEANGDTALNAIVTADSVDQAHELQARLEKLPTVGSVTSVAQFLPPAVAGKQPAVERLTGLLRGIRTPRPIPLGSAHDLLGLAALLNKRPAGNIEKVSQLQKTLERMGPGAIQDGLVGFQNGFLGDLEKMAQLLRDQRARMPTQATLPPVVRERMVGRSGRLLLTVSPNRPLRSEAELTAFVEDVRSVVPQPAGTAPILAGLAEGFHQAASHGPLLAWGTLGLLLIAFLLSPHRVVLAMLVPGLALVWSRALLGLVDLPLTPLSWPTQILVLALGVCLCLESTSRAPSRPVAWPHFLITGCFGAVWLSSHPAFSNLGQVGFLGMVCNLVATFTVLPALQRVYAEAAARVRLYAEDGATVTPLSSPANVGSSHSGGA